MATGGPKRTEAIYRHHWQAYLAKDLDALMGDYTEDSVLIIHIAPEPIRDLAAIRGFFGQVFEMLTPEILAAFRVSYESVDGEIAYAVWSAGPAIMFGTDTFVIRDGKIAVQTAAAVMAQSQ